MKWLCILCCMMLVGCSPQVGTLSLPAAAWHMQVADSLCRGLDYLGTAEGYHYFEKKREAASDIRFRIPVAQYSPPQSFAYRSCFPQRADVSAEWTGMVLVINGVKTPYPCAIGGKQYGSLSEVPAHLWRGVRVVILPSKSEAESARARASLAPYLRNNEQVFYSLPLSGIPEFMLPPSSRVGGGEGWLSPSAMEDLLPPNSPRNGKVPN